MRASEIRNMMNHNAAIQYIIQAANEGRTSVRVPKGVVNRANLESLGYNVGSNHQQADTILISWKKIEDRKGG